MLLIREAVCISVTFFSKVLFGNFEYFYRNIKNTVFDNCAGINYYVQVNVFK